MGDIKINGVLEKVAESINKEQGHKDNKKQVDRIESRLRSLLQDRGNFDVSEAMNLRGEAAALDRMADYTSAIAELMERKEQDLEKKNIEEVKELLMTQLGIPAEFVDQLGLLVKAGPQALKEASGVYRKEAQNRRDHADLITLEIEKIDKQIKELNQIRNSVSDNDAILSSSMRNFILELRYKESIRDKADLVLKEMLQQAEQGV